MQSAFVGRVVFFHVLDLHPSYTTVYAHELGMSLPIPPPLPEEIEPDWEAFLSGLPLDKVEWEKSAEEGQAASRHRTSSEARESGYDRYGHPR